MERCCFLFSELTEACRSLKKWITSNHHENVSFVTPDLYVWLTCYTKWWIQMSRHFLFYFFLFYRRCHSNFRRQCSLFSSTSAVGHVPLHGLSHHVTCQTDIALFICSSNVTAVTWCTIKGQWPKKKPKKQLLSLLPIILDNFNRIQRFLESSGLRRSSYSSL